MNKLTHKELVEIAARWMHKNAGVGVVLKELHSLSFEIPDVIGFDNWQSILIECKASRADFLSDKNKVCRKHTNGMGTWRFFCCPAGMIKVAELPPKWGLIYVDEKKKARIQYDCRVKKVPCKPFMLRGREVTEILDRADENQFEVDILEERKIMYTVMRRLYLRGFVEEIYKLNKGKAIKRAETRAKVKEIENFYTGPLEPEN